MVTPKKTLELIQMLRGVASILVVLFHITVNFPVTGGQGFLFDMFAFGWSGVDIFFVLSGFIIAYSNQTYVASPGKTVPFLKRRFIRIFPIYWVIITAFLLIQMVFLQYYNTPFEMGAGNLLATYLLLPGHIMVNGVSWSLTNELFFYLLFTLAILIPSKRLALYLLPTYFILLIIIAIAGVDLTGGNSYLDLLFFPMNMEFLLGVFIVLLFNRISEKWIWPLLLAGILLFLAGIYCFHQGIVIAGKGADPVLNRVILFGFPSFLVILALVKKEFTKHIKVKTIFLKLGDASYSIYLLHLPLVAAFFKVWVKTGITNFSVLVLLSLLLFVVVCFIGIIVYDKIEKPLIKVLSKAML